VRITLSQVTLSLLATTADASVTVGGAVQLSVTQADRSEASFLEGGYGRFGAGGEEDLRERLAGEISVDWRPATRFRLYSHLVARSQPGAFGGDPLAVVEAFGEVGGVVGEASQWTLKVGLFLPPTSFENVEARWTSPYTLTLSAINSWVGEEVRDLGTELRLVHRTEHVRWTLAAGAVGGNDSSGTLLAWRGFALHDYLVGAGEVLPLPPLVGLGGGGGFSMQLDDGTKPVGADLDGRIGWTARFGGLEEATGRRFGVRLADNRGDRELYNGEYAWRTRSAAFGVSLPFGDWTIAGEILAGKTGMGVAPTFVDLDFGSGYVLVSRALGAWRLSGRLERFETRDLDRTATEVNSEVGEAATVALFWTAGGWRAGGELLWLEVARPAGSGFAADGDGATFRLELRYGW
jgi:hypothetical protein